ncbi:MAG: hypothetical protein O3A47_07525 [Chloroflexi bacterium]|nr:hypothetical protein [Chloroflexota bacterium]
MSVKRDVEEIREGLRAGRFQNEAAVSQGIVLRLLGSLGWAIYNPNVVSPEYALEGRRVDFALCHPADKPVVFIEVKQVGKGDGAERQLFEYAFHKGVPLAILTDGQEWSFFLPAEAGDYGERRVYRLDLVEREVEESISRLERYLMYDAVSSGEALTAARSDYQDVARGRQIRDALPQAWTKLMEEEDDLLLELLADRVESLCGYKPDLDTVARFLTENIQLRATSPVPSPPKLSPRTSGVDSYKRTTGSVPSAIGFALDGRFSPCRNARHLLISVMNSLAERDSSFLERFVSLPRHGRTRRYVARDRNELYPDRPDLVQEQSYHLESGYWIGTNVSRKQVERIILMACDVSGIQYGVDLRINTGQP